MDNQMVKILMVDDRKENLLALEAVLTSPQYHLIQALSGDEALKWVLREEFACIIMDVQMPGLNGFETAKLIREREKTKDVPIIFITALSQTQENVLHGYSVGAIDYLIKPFDPTILNCKVAGFVSLFLNQKKVEEQAKIISKRTNELERANFALKKSEEMLEGLVNERTQELIFMNKKLQREIDEKEATLLQLEESEDKYRQLVEESPEAIMVRKMNSRDWCFINQTGVKLFKAKSKDDIINRPVKQFIYKNDYKKLKDFYNNSQNGEDLDSIECRMVCLNGDLIDVEIKSIPFVYQGESSFHIIIRDITELKQSREFIQQSEKLTVVGELAAGIAHEIRNPLTSLKGFTQLLSNNMDSNHEFMEIMITEIERINSIVSELLLLAKPKKLQFMNVELKNLLHSCITLMKPQANLYDVNIILTFSDHLSHFVIYGIADQMKQVFINLIKNAIEAMPDGGEIVIDVNGNDEQIEINISDKGSGIPSELFSKLGQPFFTTKEKGTGLGLMVCYSIIESHQGTMSIDSLKDKGTTVSVKLPSYQITIGN
jgi:two-component system, sporulation sensor kinase E